VAAKQGYIDIVRILIDRGAKLDLIDSTDYTPLRIAAINRHNDIVILLLEKGADPNIVRSREMSDLPIGDNIEVARLLLNKGFNVNSRDGNERTSLMICENSEVVRLLLSRGADIDAQDKDGRTALFYATMKDDVEKVSVLLEHGADYKIESIKKIKIVDMNDRKVEFQGTPLELATRKGSTSIIMLINKIERDRHRIASPFVQEGETQSASGPQVQSGVTTTSQFLINQPDAGPQIVASKDDKLKEPVHESWLKLRDFYLSFGPDFGKVGPSIPLHMQSSAGGLDSISSSNNLGLISLVIGYDISRAMSAEISYGYVNYGTQNNENRDSPNYQDAHFSTYPITAVLVYRFYRNHSSSPYIYTYTYDYDLHLDAGARYHIDTHLDTTAANVSTTVKYENALGYQVGFGSNLNLSRHFIVTFDLKYVFGLKYRFKEMEVNGVKYDSTYSDWQELDGGGILFGASVGYHF
jgi:ankyrin repeat protein/outer membrane protein W